jgi:hypothetical protein
MMNLLDLLAAEAARRDLFAADSAMDAATAFRLVRDMPYIRASSREPETIIREWRGTCSGKHYLLQALFAELGLTARLIACTSVRQFTPETLPPALYELLAPANGRFVDVHNYLILELPDGGEMIVDATWPQASKVFGLVVNEHFVWGEDQAIAAEPQQNWVVPPGEDAQAFKEDHLLATHFTPEELAAREAFLQALMDLFR